jgi:cell division protein FtsA
MARNNNIIGAIDIGSGFIKGIVVQPKRGRQQIAVLSCVSIVSEGVSRGIIIDAEVVAEKLNQAFTKLKSEIKPHHLKDVFINIGGSHIISEPGHGAVAISRADQKVSPDDRDRVIREAKPVNLNPNQEVLRIFPQEFIVDNDAGLKDAVGMKGIKLETNVLAVCVFSPYLKKMVDTVLSTDIGITEVVPSPLAAAEALLTSQQKELGVIVVDIGSETTGIAVYEDKNLIHLAVLPVGSAHITRDIAIALQVEINLAEEIKKKFGSYIFQNRNKKEKIITEKGETFIFDSKRMVKAGRARVAEIFDLVAKELKKINRQEALPAGVILTGGGSKLPGIVDFVKKQLKLPVKKGVVREFIGLEEDPSYSTVCGLVTTGIGQQEIGEPRMSGFVSRIKIFFKRFIP